MVVRAGGVLACSDLQNSARAVCSAATCSGVTRPNTALAVFAIMETSAKNSTADTCEARNGDLLGRGAETIVATAEGGGRITTERINQR